MMDSAEDWCTAVEMRALATALEKREGLSYLVLPDTIQYHHVAELTTVYIWRYHIVPLGANQFVAKTQPRWTYNFLLFDIEQPEFMLHKSLDCYLDALLTFLLPAIKEL